MRLGRERIIEVAAAGLQGHAGNGGTGTLAVNRPELVPRGAALLRD
jgi:hypothetical protein